MEVALSSTEVWPRHSREEIERATIWLFQAWALSLGIAFAMGILCWQRCGPRLRQVGLEGRPHRPRLTEETGPGHGPHREGGESPRETVATPAPEVRPAATESERGEDHPSLLAERTASPNLRPSLPAPTDEDWLMDSPGGNRARYVRARGDRRLPSGDPSRPNSVVETMVEAANRSWARRTDGRGEEL